MTNAAALRLQGSISLDLVRGNCRGKQYLDTDEPAAIVAHHYQEEREENWNYYNNYCNVYQFKQNNFYKSRQMLSESSRFLCCLFSCFFVCLHPYSCNGKTSDGCPQIYYFPQKSLRLFFCLQLLNEIEFIISQNLINQSSYDLTRITVNYVLWK